MEEKAEVKDSITSLLESLNSDLFDDSFKLKISTIFEATVNEAVAAKELELEELNAKDIELFKEELVSQTDSYLDYFVQEYIKENEVVVEDFAKVKLAEKVIRNFNQMCEAFNISLSEESISNDNEVDELKTENNKLINKLIDSEKTIEIVKRAAIIAEASVGGTDLQIEKMIEMAKGLEFESEEIFESKLATILEKIIKESVTNDDVEKLEEKEEIVEQKKVISESMSKYLRYLK